MYDKKKLIDILSTAHAIDFQGWHYDIDGVYKEDMTLLISEPADGDDYCRQHEVTVDELIDEENGGFKLYKLCPIDLEEAKLK